jgi:CDGSH-type Zn-finger protein
VICEECGREVENLRFTRRSKRFCSDKCRYRRRDRLRYERDPEGARLRSKRYYAQNREQVLAKAAAKRGRPRLCACGERTHSPKSPYCAGHSQEAAERRRHRRRAA